MRVLVTNDDGVAAPGIAALARAAVDAGHDVVVAAPAEQSSGAGAAITADQRDGNTPVRRARIDGLPDVPVFAVSAQPAHIVLAAVHGWLDPAPDLVLSGINHGANTGRVVLHSGTVGAALTAGVHGVRGLAVSLAVALHPDGEQRHWETAGALLPEVLELLLDLPEGAVLSLNVPDLPARDVRELRHARLARFGAVRARVDSSGGDHWHVQEIESDEPPEPGTDAALLADAHPTLTALGPVQEDPSVPLEQRIREARDR